MISGQTGSCGDSDNEDHASLVCNCDANDDQWRQDAGYLTHKDDLPVYSVEAGDTGRLYMIYML